MQRLDTNGYFIWNVRHTTIGKVWILKESENWRFISLNQKPVNSSTYTISVPKHKNISWWCSKLTDDAYRIRYIKIWNSKRAQNEASAIFEIPVLSNNFDSRHHWDGSESRVVAINRIPHTTPNFFWAASLGGTDDSYHSTVTSVVKCWEHEELESRSVYHLPIAISSFGLGRVGWKVRFDLGWKHLSPWNRIRISVRGNWYAR